MSEPIVFTRVVEFDAAWNKRDPDPSKDYGIGAAKIRFTLKGPRGATYLAVSTGWFLPADRVRLPQSLTAPNGHGVGYHSPTPMREGQGISIDACEHIGGGPCYSDANYSDSDRVLERLIAEGDSAVWEELEKVYASYFGEAAP